MVLRYLRILKSTQDITLFQQSFERIIGLFATLSFHDHNLTNIHEKIGTREKGPHNQIVQIIEVRLYLLKGWWSMEVVIRAE